MKYRTVIELICDAPDRDEAANMAGDYLKGDVDFGVEMQTRTVSLWAHRAAKYAVSGMIVLMVFASFLLKVTPLSVESEQGGVRYTLGFEGTSTVMPELKTQHGAEFKTEWERKTDDAVLDYLRN